jgi:hypothetical protein
MALFPVEPDSTVKVALPESELNIRGRPPWLAFPVFCIKYVVPASLLASNVSDLRV